MSKQKYLGLIACCCCFVWGFSACSKGIITPAPTRIVLEIETSGTINPDLQRIPSPVVVRFYQLKSPLKFVEADFISLYENDKQVLGEDLVHRREILLRPNDKKFIDFEVGDAVKAIAGLAAFRQHQAGRWSALVMIESHKTTTIHVSVTGTTITMAQKP